MVRVHVFEPFFIILSNVSHLFKQLIRPKCVEHHWGHKHPTIPKKCTGIGKMSSEMSRLKPRVFKSNFDPFWPLFLAIALRIFFSIKLGPISL